MKHSDMNHLRRLLGWVRCEIGQAPDDMVATVQDIGAKLGAVAMTDEAMGRMVAAHDASRRVPAYVRAAIKALEKATFAAVAIEERRDGGMAGLKTAGQIAHEAGAKHDGWARCWSDCSESQKAAWELIAADVVQAAVLVERERCALVADEDASACRQNASTHHKLNNHEMMRQWDNRADTCRLVAFKIRKGP